MKKNIFFGMSVILIITCAIVFSCYLISKKLIPIPGNNSMKDVSSTTTEPPELMASVITPDESCITGTPSPPHLENELEMYVLQKVDDDLYQNKDMFFRVDNDGTLYIKNYSGEYDIFCNAEKPGLHTAVEAVPEDIHSRYKEIMNEYGKRKQLNFNGLNDYYYICSYEDYDYFELKIINGAGSGEYWGGKNSGIYLGIHQTTGELKEFGDFRAGVLQGKR